MSSSRAVMMMPRARGRMAPVGANGTCGQSLKDTQRKRTATGQRLTCLGGWMSSHYWSWFGDGSIAANVTLRDWRAKVKKYFIQIHVFNESLPVSVCLVVGGATVAGLKAGPERVKKKKSQTFFFGLFF